ncbi:carboxypeptidase-like regulatory domain-containing protein [Hymenobacter sp. RP-2-7]|uniref:Carboxypeptidase-like regulatory domain-containing protein n=1 Tax=Hymenobacter polaris TaxID=2682546 RepID=A0A7Y0AGL4_9BACT|nr:carboxypeptidase-like regulatory domain-containing protein [Hymenobacter polaris]NML66812.1 carboxypeptidase-like regulatory domain-containing protein [Hymenobacter polaris]
MKYFLLIGGFLLAGARVAGAQTAPVPAPVAAAPGPPCSALSGYVMGSDRPLAGATVAIPGTRLLAITNSEGYYTLPTANVAKPTLLFSAAGYEPQSITPTTCADEHVEMQLLPGTRIKQRGKRKGFIMKTAPSVQ